MAPLGVFAEPAPVGEVIPPCPKRYFNDYGGVTTPAFREAQNRLLEALGNANIDQFVVAIFPRMPSSARLDEYCRRVFDAWGVGQKGVNNGVVLFVFVGDHKVRIQVGCGSEPVLTDAIAQSIVNLMVPYFRRGDDEGGIAFGVDCIIKTLQPPNVTTPGPTKHEPHLPPRMDIPYGRSATGTCHGWPAWRWTARFLRRSDSAWRAHVEPV